MMRAHGSRLMTALCGGVPGCGRRDADTSPPRRPLPVRLRLLRETPAPLMAGVETSLQGRIRASYASLTSAQRTQASDVELGALTDRSVSYCSPRTLRPG